MSRNVLTKRHRLMLRWSIPCLAAVTAVSAIAYVQSMPEDPSAANPDGSITGLTSVLERDISEDMVRFSFEEVGRTAGIHFRHFPSERNSLLPEDMGSGLAWGDYDNDGDDDLFIVNFKGTILDTQQKADSAGCCALYRNDDEGRFVDVSAAVGLDIALFGMAAAWGDYDNDGDLDLYLTAYGPNRLFRNDGGHFTDVTADAKLGDSRFSSGCAWGDYNRDGHIDLYVCTYTDFQYSSSEPPLINPGEQNPYTINPSSYPPDTNRLYRNNGDGTFTDVAQSVGVADPTGRSLGVVWFDFNNDHYLDLYVANDVSANAVLLNQGDGTFADVGASSLAADYRGAMGLAVGDVDSDADLDVLVTHWVAQENALFHNQHKELADVDDGHFSVLFMDVAEEFGLGQISLNAVGWATSFVDFDNDGTLDLWVVNGNTLQFPDDPKHMMPQRMHIFRQIPPKGFFEVGQYALPLADIVGRGGAQADYDDDGRMDLAVLVHGGDVLLLHNSSASAGHWVKIELRQTARNTRALGARVEVRTGKVVQFAQVGTGGSYLSQSPSWLHFGLGMAETVDEITILWPDGYQESVLNLPADQTYQFRHTWNSETGLTTCE